jgi:uncharacterized protein (TIGR00369 family)
VSGFRDFAQPDANRPAQGREVGRYVGLDLRETEEGRIRGVARVHDWVRAADGRMRPGPMLTLLDSVGGLNGGLAALPDGWVVSTNLAARFVDHAHDDALVFESEILRKGRNSVVTAVRASNESDGVVVADGLLTSSVLIPEGGPPQWVRPVVLPGLDPPEEGYPVVEEWLATRVVDATTVEMDLHEHMRNPWGILHGGVVSMLIELAVEHTTAMQPVDIAMHFLAPNRVGPRQACARPIGTRTDATVLRVEVRDVGAGRLTALAVVVVPAGT